MSDTKTTDKCEFAGVPAEFIEEAKEHDARLAEEAERMHKRGKDAVEQAALDSFPASDPPSRTVTRGALVD